MPVSTWSSGGGGGLLGRWGSRWKGWVAWRACGAGGPAEVQGAAGSPAGQGLGFSS